MPNDVENIVRINGDEQRIREMLEAIKDDECGIGTIDFNKIIPMPESLAIEAGSRTDRGLKAYKDFIEVYTLAGTRKDLDLLDVPLESEKAFLDARTDIKPDEWELGKQAFQNIQKYGHSTWYHWCIHNWGTKWNAYGYDTDTNYKMGDNLWFQTAWSAPHPILEKLSDMYPDLRFEHEWADEDIGYNCGRLVYFNGGYVEEYLPEGEEATAFAMNVWGYEPAEQGLALNKTGTEYISTINGEYELIELFGKPALFTNERLTDADIPEGLYCYHLRESDDGDRFGSIEPEVAVNHGGSVITDEPLDFGEAGYIEFTDDTSPNFLGNDITFEEYMRGDFEPDQTQGEQQL